MDATVLRRGSYPVSDENNQQRGIENIRDHLVAFAPSRQVPTPIEETDDPSGHEQNGGDRCQAED